MGYGLLVARYRGRAIRPAVREVARELDGLLKGGHRVYFLNGPVLPSRYGQATDPIDLGCVPVDILGTETP